MLNYEISETGDNAKQCLEKIVWWLVMNGIEVKLMAVDSPNVTGLGYDLNLQAKSSIVLYIDESVPGISWKSRYDTGVFEPTSDQNELMWQVLRCMYGRYYICPKWREILKMHGVIITPVM